MRKRTVNHVADTVFWYSLYFLPVLAYLLYLLGCAKGTGVVEYINFTEFFMQFCDIMTNNIVFDSLYNIFGDEGIMPVFNDNAVFYFFTWFINVYLIHLMVDFILFIPRYAHKWLKEFTRGDE